MKNMIVNFHGNRRKTLVALILYLIISSTLYVVFLASANTYAAQLDSLLNSKYSYSASFGKECKENNYFQFNAGIWFAVSPEERTSLNADVVMQSPMTTYTDLVNWNASKLAVNNIAITENISRTNGLKIGDKLYSEHIVDGKIYEYTITQILPEAKAIRSDADAGKTGIIIMGYDPKYAENISHTSLFFTQTPVEKILSEYGDMPVKIIYRDDDIFKSVRAMFPYVSLIAIISIIVTVVFVNFLTKDIASNFRRFVIIGVQKQKVNRSYAKTIGIPGFISIVGSILASELIWTVGNYCWTDQFILLLFTTIDVMILLIRMLSSGKKLWRQ